jgi:small subunit ribosomal protein S1
LADHKVDNPEDVVKVGQRVEVRIIKIDSDERKIGLTLIQAHFEESEEAEVAPKKETAERAAPAQPALGSLADQLKGIGQRMSEREAQKKTQSDS